MIKKLLLFLAAIFLIGIPNPASAFKAETFVTISNPVRGYDGWGNKEQFPLDLPKFQYQESTPSALPITWLLRFDAVSDASISAYFANLIELDANQFLGAFLEITPSLTNKAEVAYPEGNSISNANRIFLSGYEQKDRLRLIDTYMEKFFSRFGFYPKSVAAWHIDSFSLQYLQSKYSVLAAMNCDDQYSTDSYRLWGGYLGSPYFPDKNNSLIPASGLNNRVNLAMVRWAQRDLYNFYGYRSESSFSVQINDYLSMGQNTKYFESLLSIYSQKKFNEFTHVNLGLENDYSLKEYRQEIKNVYNTLKNSGGKYDLHPISLADFGDWLKARFPESSPTYFYRTKDSTGREEGEVFWYQTPKYRIGLKALNGKTSIIDFRAYNRGIYEENYATPNQNLGLHSEIPAIIDSIKNPNTELILDINLSQFETNYDKQWDYWQISLADSDQKITFYPDSINFSNIFVPDIKSLDLKITSKNHETKWEISPHMPLADTYNYSWIFWLLLVIAFFIIIKKIMKEKPKTPIFLVVGFISIMLIGITVFRNSLTFPFGLGFFGPNGHDAIFHLSLIEKFSINSLNFSHPQLSGVMLSNYHFVFDYFSGILSGLFQIPAPTLYFRVLPFIFGVALVFLLNKLMSKWSYSPFEKALSYILVFFSGSFGFIPKLLTGQDIFSGESAFWSNQSASLFLNPPFALSLIFLIMFLVALPSSGKIKPVQFIKLALLGGLLAQTKVYAFVLLPIALLFNKRFSLMVAIGIIGALITLPFSSFSGLPFTFDPLWFPKSLFASYDRFYWPRFVQAWQSYEASGSYLKLFMVNLFATLVYLVGNLGIRILGFFGMSKIKTPDISEKIVISIIIIGLILPLVIVQKVNPWNTIQFTYYSLFFLGLFTAKVISKITMSIKNKYLRVSFLVVIIFLATATSVGTLKDYIGNTTPARVSYTEMLALETLRNQPQGIVLSPLYKKSDWIATPKPLYAYVSTAYISALSGQPEFMSDTINLDITGFDYKERAREIQRFYNTGDKEWGKSFLKENNIKYVYETPLQKMKTNPHDFSLTIIFESGEISIYKTN